MFRLIPFLKNKIWDYKYFRVDFEFYQGSWILLIIKQMHKTDVST